MGDDNSYRIEPRRIGLGQGLAPSPEDIERLQQRMAQAQHKNRPKPRKTFGQVLGRGARPAPSSARPPSAAPTGRPAGPPGAAGGTSRKAPAYGGAAQVKATGERPAAPSRRAAVLPQGRRVVATLASTRMPHGLRHPGERHLFGIRTAMLIVLKG